MVSKELLDQYTNKWILRYYPEEKQRSDYTDQLFWTSWLTRYTNLTTNEIGKEIYLSSTNIMLYDSDLNIEVNNLVTKYGDGTKLAWKQLIKVGVRTGWIQQIKQMYYQILQDPNITDNQLYFKIREIYISMYDGF